MSEWMPGDVAAWVNSSGVPVVAIRSYKETWNGVDPYGDRYTERPSVPFAQPLVVIDPRDREQVERLAGLIRANRDDSGGRGLSWNRATTEALREFADPTPPCGASLTLGKVGALYRCSEPRDHDGPHNDGTCTWTAKS